ncbi:hypothetical protein AVEN_215737-1 [Araneus ventricosus]|uniref:Uncharacterized protein n=1 Tax=Araneus ventricosus TaxID=182803 RepID=A0A4Y2FM90_ARAVE|nr:hypothetical protein AVEN_215737-1 [Araneus ventricosus]
MTAAAITRVLRPSSHHRPRPDLSRRRHVLSMVGGKSIPTRGWWEQECCSLQFQRSRLRGRRAPGSKPDSTEDLVHVKSDVEDQSSDVVWKFEELSISSGVLVI